MSSQEKWITVFRSTNSVHAEIIRGNIENAGIPCVILNKQSSSYLTTLPGAVELQVPAQFLDQALSLLREAGDIE
ncbi:MAG: DUF2007 domain-containing protein [Chitinophagaceae bacterium]|uniref:DUF2007 domain-containing protein n=1 Tax=Rurimicrobium arvi TaxID=2049916 RepID=A0ABP8MEG8_9BACT